jgi:hypothetical protein
LSVKHLGQFKIDKGKNEEEEKLVKRIWIAWVYGIGVWVGDRSAQSVTCTSVNKFNNDKVFTI